MNLGSLNSETKIETNQKSKENHELDRERKKEEEKQKTNRFDWLGEGERLIKL